jgi:hypothetical protein
MIEDLDEALRRLLVRDLPVKNGEVDIQFDQPKREWSARLSRPTLDLFLYDVRENNKLRQAQPAWEVEYNDDGTATRRRRPVRMDLHYMITAWAPDPEDEHRLLSRTLLALFRYPHIPAELLPEGLQGQEVPIATMVAQEEDLTNPADVWSAMDNEMRPMIVCVATLAIDPYQPVTAPLVTTREVLFGQTPAPSRQQLEERAGTDGFWAVGGRVRSDRPLENLHLTLVEGGLEVPVQPAGRFVIGRLRAGEYTLEVSSEGRKPQRHKIVVPSPGYDLEVG